jgi:hypothetical protein
MAIYRRNRQRKSIYKKGFLQSHGLQKARPKKFPFSIGLVRNRFRSRALFNIVRDAENLSKIKFRKGYEERYLIGKARLAVRIQNNAQLLVKSKRGSKAQSGGKRAAEQNDKPRHKQSVSIGKKRLKKSSGLWIIPKEDGFGYATLYSHHNYVPAFRSRRWR